MQITERSGFSAATSREKRGEDTELGALPNIQCCPCHQPAKENPTEHPQGFFFSALYFYTIDHRHLQDGVNDAV